ncbi:hypothetical protein DNU06_12860 [Putridiphycobacter roseus]|uniref:Uncharacterized protein n=1 Tax=Putridiphycobacter roseus TaxID=2219161 RepID=A0A2W1NBH7_9FLAO|nr:hypothetical protein [Putridiphycobacter roseus]PZE16433.1 hypothetical protein DNU06_12860 [Putridiphycobacter roseus]
MSTSLEVHVLLEYGKKFGITNGSDHDKLNPTYILLSPRSEYKNVGFSFFNSLVWKQAIVYLWKNSTAFGRTVQHYWSTLHQGLVVAYPTL